MQKILIIEDDLDLGTTLTGALEMQNYEVHYQTNGTKIAEELQKFQPDIILLDVMLNDKLDGFEIARCIRTKYNTPIIFTTSRDGNEDFKAGFQIGNTDYVRKPYRIMEVLLRIDSLLSKQISRTKPEITFQIGKYNFFAQEQTLMHECEKIHLNNYESAVLTLLCKRRDNYTTREELIKQVWGETQAGIKTASLNNTLSRLKKHLAKDKQVQIVSIIKLGVKLEVKE
jgi:DNA-binding response OmpR family regulator